MCLYRKILRNWVFFWDFLGMTNFWYVFFFVLDIFCLVYVFASYDLRVSTGLSVQSSLQMIPCFKWEPNVCLRVSLLWGCCLFGMVWNVSGQWPPALWRWSEKVSPALTELLVTFLGYLYVSVEKVSGSFEFLCILRGSH